MKVTIYLLAILVSASGFREVINIGCFLYNRTQLQEVVCVNKLNKTKKCKGKCYLAKKLKQNKSSKDPLIPGYIECQQLEWFLPESMWTNHTIKLDADKQWLPEYPFVYGDYTRRLVDPPDVCSNS